jgi:heptosyltransferase-2
VTTPLAAPLLETHPAVRQVIPYDKRGTDQGWSGIRRLGKRLKTEGYSCAYLPHRSLRSAALALLAGIPARTGFRGRWSFLYTVARLKPPSGHESDRLLALADEAPGAYPPQLRPSVGDERVADALVAGAETFIALAPGSIWGSKRWPYYGELAAKLAAHVTIVIVGGKDDAETGDAIVRAVGPTGRRAVNACGKLTLRQSAALIGRAAVLVTNDSAPLHLATAMGTPIVALFGPTVSEFGFGPMRAADVALGVELECRPCSPHGPRQCPLEHHRCMRDLPVEAVTQAIEDLGALRRRN